MLILRRKGKRVGGVHKVYTSAEAEELGIAFTDDWKNAEVGQWVRSSDGWVAQLLSRDIYPDKQAYKDGYKAGILYFPYGRTTTRYKELSLRKHIRNPNNLGGTPWPKVFLNKLRGKMFVLYYCYMVINTGKVDYVKLGNIISSGKNPQVRARIYMRNPDIMSEVKKTLKQILFDKGITHEQIVDDLVKLKDDAFESKDRKYVLEVLDRFSDMTNLYGKLHDPQSGDMPENSGVLSEAERRFQELLLDEKSSDMDEDGKVRIPVRRDPQGHLITDGKGNPVTEIGDGWK